MTTISYNHKDKEIAVDSCQTMGSKIITLVADKTITEDGVIFVFTGSDCDKHLFVDYYFNRQKSDLLPDCSALVADSGKAYSVTVNEHGNVDKFEMVMNFSVGSGSDFASSAMDYGASAKEAVKHAITRDIYTGGKVHVIKVK